MMLCPGPASNSDGDLSSLLHLASECCYISSAYTQSAMIMLSLYVFRAIAGARSNV